MTIILYTGEFMTANKIEFSYDGKRLILDGEIMIETSEVIAIVR